MPSEGLFNSGICGSLIHSWQILSMKLARALPTIVERTYQMKDLSFPPELASRNPISTERRMGLQISKIIQFIWRFVVVQTSFMYSCIYQDGSLSLTAPRRLVESACSIRCYARSGTSQAGNCLF